MFKLSVCEKVGNEHEKSPDALAPGLIDTLSICLKSRSYSVWNEPYKKRVERIINTRLWFNSNH